MAHVPQDADPQAHLQHHDNQQYQKKPDEAMIVAITNNATD
ncbi:MAG TPA: hypothetical protein PLX97_05290 [Gemmatales bacterium]|nr:hypothetical protein [Gemmatales bacterium]